jgi:Na+/proline symporter
MQLNNLDWGIIFAFFIISLLIGIWVNKKAGSSSTEFFLSGRNMPWWLLGVSMVATTFAADTPNFVANVVRKNGVAGNWEWWAFLLTGMLTVFIYAKLWRKLGVSTDLEFYEIRYKGKIASFLRGFRALYLGVFFNVVIMANVMLAGVKIGHVMLGLSPFQTLFIASVVTVIYSILGGLKGVLITDFFQFIIAMTGSVLAAYFIIDLPEINGLDALFSNEVVQSKMALFPDKSQNYDLWVSVLAVPLAVQWWSVWYPGAEPGGGGYIAQRMLAAKDEKHATAATLFFNFAHYALRPWPWIIIALASLILFPDLASLQARFPDLPVSLIKDDLAYPAMLTFLPAGLLGLVIASLVAAFMSTISTHLNWGSSYVTFDFYKRFINPEASEKKLVLVGRISTVIMIILAALLSLVLEEAKEGFNLILQIGAGTGLLFILRWFWKAVNPYSEIAAMGISFLVATVFFVGDKSFGWEFSGTARLLYGVGITTIGWILVTLLTKNSNLENPDFDQRAFGDQSPWKGIGYKVLGIFAGSIGIYAALFGIGYWIYGQLDLALNFGLIFIAMTGVIIGLWKRLFD